MTHCGRVLLASVQGVGVGALRGVHAVGIAIRERAAIGAHAGLVRGRPEVSHRYGSTAWDLSIYHENLDGFYVAAGPFSAPDPP